jgi:hypothetical protein
MARGIGGRYGTDQGGNPARSAFSPLNTAATSPRVSAAPMSAASAPSGDVGDTPATAMQQAASPTYGVMSAGAVTNSNRIGG